MTLITRVTLLVLLGLSLTHLSEARELTPEVRAHLTTHLAELLTTAAHHGEVLGETHEPCQLIDTQASVPEGFASPLNLFSSQSELIFSTTCSDTEVTLTLGSGENTQAIYNQGYVWHTNEWQPVTFSGPTPNGESYYTGLASTTIERPQDDTQSVNFALGYMCTWQDSEWKCGCETTCAPGKTVNGSVVVRLVSAQALTGSFKLLNTQPPLH